MKTSDVTQTQGPSPVTPSRHNHPSHHLIIRHTSTPPSHKRTFRHFKPSPSHQHTIVTSSLYRHQSREQSPVTYCTRHNSSSLFTSHPNSSYHPRICYITPSRVSCPVTSRLVPSRSVSRHPARLSLPLVIERTK
ncbi:hypothetical protein E2C01_043574 [Portunus trituberculatus]|uniref:Uncharacterized protein n=1 Tax=Portunus trituberculatus TaxID=210409 RepID=A0A5B7FQM7_PORTR|nr:hypothetical protein [Portunus trituberculatus]